MFCNHGWVSSFIIINALFNKVFSATCQKNEVQRKWNTHALALNQVFKCFIRLYKTISPIECSSINDLTGIWNILFPRKPKSSSKTWSLLILLPAILLVAYTTSGTFLPETGTCWAIIEVCFCWARGFPRSDYNKSICMHLASIFVV